MFPSQTLLLAALFAVSANGAPEPRPTAAAVAEKFVVVDTFEDATFGKFILYGPAPGTNSTAPAVRTRACGSNDVVCDGSNVPDQTSCVNLINYIGANGNTVYGPSTRAICESTNGLQCCVSWAANTPGMPIGDLYNAAVKTYNSCVVHGQSGQIFIKGIAMVVEHADRVLWQPIISHFSHQLGTLILASDVQTAQRHIIDTAMQLMREIIANWNRLTITYRLPPELLAYCFSFLSFGDLLGATRVSRTWRATALSCPRLWSTLTFESAFSNPDIVGMAMARSRQLPLNLVFQCDRSSGELVAFLKSHMHRVQHLAWVSRSVGFLTQPAPLLESLTCDQLRPIPEGLLGGSPGRLRRLRVHSLRLPVRCPALSSLTSLYATLNFRFEDAASLAHLFTVCPLLECLDLNGVADEHYPYLFSGTPTRLQSLTLRMGSRDTCDLMSLVRSWAPNNPRLSRICLHIECSPANGAPVFEDAVTLSVSVDHPRGNASIETKSSRGRQFTLVVHSPWNTTVNYDTVSNTVADIIRPHTALLDQLRVLSAPVTVLDALFRQAPPMPALRTLSVVVQMWIPEDRPFIQRILCSDESCAVFPTAHLACLAELQPDQLARIEIAARTTRRIAIREDNVQDLLETLAKSLPARDRQEEPVEVVLRGLPGLTSDALPQVQGYRIAPQAQIEER
ncbi:hypothetical protein AURDEDRAFT_164212 [Auricularia subglabra TFB-10046 SS5]|nr:hypothetical protein AURDEDRAFT_164212 [Auricularia subglabra TFB-10046 SS5]